MNSRIPPGIRRPSGFGTTELMVVVGLVLLLIAILMPLLTRWREGSRQSVCANNLGQVAKAVLMYAENNQKTLPQMTMAKPPGGWWWYKEQVKQYAGLMGTSSVSDKVFACPSDRGYGGGEDDTKAFWASAKHDFNSYVFNGVNLPGMPNVAGRSLGAINQPQRTLLVMEWTAHAPLSWHKSRTGQANAPFYNDAESVVAFVDGHVKLVKIYYDGMNPAYTRDPIPGYEYKYSAE